MIDRLAMNDFRGIPSLALDDLGKVNVLIGANAAGKTSVLEAVSIAANPFAAQLVRLSQWREMLPPTRGNDDALRVYFHNLDLAVVPCIRFQTDSGEQRVAIHALTGVGVTTTSDATVEGPAPIEPQTELRGVRLVYTAANGNSVESRLELAERAALGEPVRSAEYLGVFYIHARRATSAGETARLLTTLYEKKRESELIDVIRRVDDRVQRLWPGVRDVGPTVLVDIGLPRMLPMNALGDGFCRVALMATGLLLGNSKLLVVDEVDSGLHYSVMASVWEGILSLAHDRQVFCATHNEEMLRSTLAGFDKDRDALRIYRLDRVRDGGVRAQKYTYDSFAESERAGLEIR